MEKTDDTYTAWGLNDGTHETQNLKPMLTPEEQVKLLKSKGIAFERCDEQKAIEALARRGTFLHLTACRRLFQRFEDGPDEGRYISLDFADLLDMDELDAMLRRDFLLVSQDVERLAKTAIITRISEDENEDGYSIVADFMESQESRYRGYIVRDLHLRRNEEDEGDVYSGRIISHYEEAMPIWAFLEVVTFGTLLAFYLFCSRRWGDDVMREEHYILKGVKTVRNCCSHGSCILNGMDKSYESDYTLSSIVYDWLNEKNVPNSKTRRAKLKNRRVQQLLEALVMFDRLGGSSLCANTDAVLERLKGHLLDACNRYGEQNGFVSYLRFLANLIDKTV